jgi:peptidoglycan hydrolase CwlO-like protein
MVRSLARRERRPLWSVLSFLLAIGLGLSLWAASQAKSGSVKDTTNAVRIVAQTDLAPMLQPRDLTAPIVGERASELGSQIERTIMSEGPIEEVRIYSAVGRILYAEDPSIVGTRPSYIRDLTAEVASGHARSVVRGGRLQTYVPIWLTPDGTVVVAELSQPYAPIAGARSGDWQRLAMIAAALLVVSLAMVVTTSRAAPRVVMEAREAQPTPSRGAVSRASASSQRTPAAEKPAYAQEGFRQVEERRQEAERRAQAAEQNLGGLQKQLTDALARARELEGRLAVKDSEGATNGSELKAIREELRDTAERLKEAELDNAALRERMALRQREFDELARKAQKLESAAPNEDVEALKAKLADAERRNAEMSRDIERLEAELDSTKSSFHMTKLSEALREFDTPDEGETEDQENKERQASVKLRGRRGANAPEKVR